MITTRHTMIKTLLAVTLLLQLINTAWASNHHCCPEDNPGCIMVNMAMGCTACAAFAIPAKELTQFNESRTLIKTAPASLNYLSVNNHAIWRPPLFSSFT